MGVDAVGRAGDQGAVVLALLDGQIAHLRRQDDAYLVYLVGQRLIQYLEQEEVSRHQLVQVREQPRAGQAPVAGKHAVGPLAPYGQGGPLHVAHGDLQDRVARAVVDGEGAFDLRDVDIAHDAGAGDIQAVLIELLIFFGKKVGVGLFRQGGVVGLRFAPDPVVVRVVHGGHGVGVAGDGPRLVERVPIIAQRRVDQQAHAHDQHRDQEDGGQILLHRLLAVRGGPGASAPGAMLRVSYFSSALMRFLVTSRTTAPTVSRPPRA